MYDRPCGPGTFETTRLCTGRAPLTRLLAYTRIATPNTAGAANCVQSCGRFEGIAQLCCLATESASVIALGRSAGSSMRGTPETNAITMSSTLTPKWFVTVLMHLGCEPFHLTHCSTSGDVMAHLMCQRTRGPFSATRLHNDQTR
ncbi:hypothetical protein A4X20_21685 [Mycolicibacterium iranicum]|uniref:Uncharacterized protein n=1 Tax=Mycolicibacterium iranicum TaxID=912594 RepID=A0A178LVX6_MYCIR|nr:hypothetical protein A4X20_21685 [Mycolicibacterium iranicum]